MLRNKLDNTQKLRYDELYEQSRKLYPNYPNCILEDTIFFYIKNNEDDDCFKNILNEINKAKLRDIIEEKQQEREKDFIVIK